MSEISDVVTGEYDLDDSREGRIKRITASIGRGAVTASQISEDTGLSMDVIYKFSHKGYIELPYHPERYTRRAPTKPQVSALARSGLTRGQIASALDISYDTASFWCRGLKVKREGAVLPDVGFFRLVLRGETLNSLGEYLGQLAKERYSSRAGGEISRPYGREGARQYLKRMRGSSKGISLYEVWNSCRENKK